MPKLPVPLSDPSRSAVQQIVRSVGTALGCLAGVVDREFNPLVEADGVSSLRGATQWALRLRQVGGFASLRPFWLPADPAIAAPATVWAPIRCDRRLLGFLWLVHPEALLSREEMERAELAAREIADALRHAPADGDVLLEELAGGDARARQRAALRVLEEHPHLANVGVAALAIVAREDGGDLRSQSLGEVARGYPFRLIAEDHIAVLVPGSPSDLDAVANRMAAQVNGMVGIGQWYPHLRFAHKTYQEALGAVRVAARLTELGPVVRWTALGVYRAFAHLPEGTLAYSSVHPGLERLFAEPAHQQLLATLETYLDLAGNVPLAAQRLHLHRASLYYRLHRVEQLLQADLRDGHQRLCLHMAFKLGRFTGRYPRPGSGSPVGGILATTVNSHRVPL
ncbi:PucR family transcriptional regulator [Allorhizocola rhizosphaerae]|uniref:PucR family transcriptional regulator n=1 Tax=Allorhizocola rhizosphaerae TaxID=1872709 RepID=UPI0013C34A72|nr:helix-turn-helix domain-containing protein [Allorhizocola rhizosphaerae]